MEGHLEQSVTRKSSRDSLPLMDVDGSCSSSKSSIITAKGSVKIKEEKRSDGDSIDSGCSGEMPHKVPNRIIANWRHACDRTRDRTRDLLKRWRTLPEYEVVNSNSKSTAAGIGNGEQQPQQNESGWSVHIWTTWVDRMSVDVEETCEADGHYQLTPIQAHKLSHFFTRLLDHDQDDLISEQDFQTLIERLRHFADWSMHSPEYNILREIERGFLDMFLQDFPDDKIGFHVNKQAYLTIDGWLYKWAQLISCSRNLSDFPVWLQYFVKVLFQVINRSASGIITRDELCEFYTSVLCLDAIRVSEILPISYQTMTSNGDHTLDYKAYRLCFSNYLLGRYPNGPGQYILGATPVPASSAPFPVDYSALNAQPEDLEQYAPNAQTNRRSVIV